MIAQKASMVKAAVPVVPRALEDESEVPTEHILALKDAAEQGFDLRGSLGQRFTKNLKDNAHDRAEYGAIQSRQGKADYKKKWAAVKYDQEVVVGKEKKT